LLLLYYTLYRISWKVKLEYFTGILHCLGRNFQSMYYLLWRTTAFPSCPVSVDILCRHFRPDSLLFHKSAFEQAKVLENNTATKIDTAKQYLNKSNKSKGNVTTTTIQNRFFKGIIYQALMGNIKTLKGGILSSLRDYWIHHRKYWAPHGEYSASYGEHWAPYDRNRDREQSRICFKKIIQTLSKRKQSKI